MKSSGCWNVRARPLPARDRGEAPVTSCPPRTTRPAFGPQQPRQHREEGRLAGAVRADEPGDAPGPTSMETSESAVSPPKRTVTPLAAMAGAVPAPPPSGSGPECCRRRVTRRLRPPGARRPRCPTSPAVRLIPSDSSGPPRPAELARSNSRRSRRPFSARAPSGYLAAEIAPRPKRMDSQTGRFVMFGQ